MAVRLTDKEIERLQSDSRVVAWRPLYSRNVHLRWADGDRWTLCNEVRPLDSSHIPFDWVDKFCERCVGAVFISRNADEQGV